MIHVLCCSANPDTEDMLRIDAEMREIRNAIAPAARREFKVEHFGAMRLIDLPVQLLGRTPDIFHFSGHGSKKGELIFEDEYGGGHPVDGETLRLIFENLGKGIKCVVLNSCYTVDQAKLINEYVPYVIGNTSEIEDSLSIRFSATFYRCLSHGKSFEESYKIAKGVITGSNKKKEEINMLVNRKKFPLTSSTLFAHPVTMAKFVENSAGNPARDGTNFKMTFWVENCPSTATSIIYNFKYIDVSASDDDREEEDESVDYSQEVMVSPLGIECCESFYGDVQLRITFWFADEGIGILTTIYESLSRYYSGQKLKPTFRKALEQFKPGIWNKNGR